MSQRLKAALQYEKIIMLRGVGYLQSEIAEELGVAPSVISYHLDKIREMAEREGADNTFIKLCLGPRIRSAFMRFLKLNGGNLGDLI